MAPMTEDWRGPSKPPLAWLTLAAAMARAQVLQGQAVGRQGGGVGLNPHRRPLPAADADQPTPGSWEIFWASRVSARSSTLGRGRVLEVRARVRMGASAGLTLL